jgi:hypothetical protein
MWLKEGKGMMKGADQQCWCRKKLHIRHTPRFLGSESEYPTPGGTHQTLTSHYPHFGGSWGQKPWWPRTAHQCSLHGPDSFPPCLWITTHQNISVASHITQCSINKQEADRIELPLRCRQEEKIKKPRTGKMFAALR